MRRGGSKCRARAVRRCLKIFESEGEIMHKYRGGNGKASGKDPMAFDTLLIIRLVAASLIFAAALVLGNLPDFVSVILLALSAVVAGYDIALDAVSDFSDRDFFSTSVVVTAITVVSCTPLSDRAYSCFLCGGEKQAFRHRITALS